MNDEQRHPDADHTLPDALSSIAAELDALAHRARAAAPRDLEARLLTSVMRAGANVFSPAALDPLPFPNTRSASMPWRLAASIGLLVATVGGAFWLAARGPLTAPGHDALAMDALVEPESIAADLEAFLSASDTWDLGVGASVASARDAIDASAVNSGFWSSDDWDDLLLEDTL